MWVASRFFNKCVKMFYHSCCGLFMDNLTLIYYSSVCRTSFNKICKSVLWNCVSDTSASCSGSIPGLFNSESKFSGVSLD